MGNVRVGAAILLFSLLLVGCQRSNGPSQAALGLMAKADAVDGTVDHVISKCVICNLGMEGRQEHSAKYGEYSVRLCSQGCNEAFSRDPEKALSRLSFPKRKE
jgi:hypothetical protein